MTVSAAVITHTYRCTNVGDFPTNEAHEKREEAHEDQCNKRKQQHRSEEKRLVYLYAAEQTAGYEPTSCVQLPEDKPADGEHHNIEVIALEKRNFGWAG